MGYLISRPDEVDIGQEDGREGGISAFRGLSRGRTSKTLDPGKGSGWELARCCLHQLELVLIPPPSSSRLDPFRKMKVVLVSGSSSPMSAEPANPNPDMNHTAGSWTAAP